MVARLLSDRLRDTAPVLLRLSLSVLFLWFGINQLFDPESFVSYVPNWVPIDIFTVVLINGLAEIVLGVLLLLGIWTRVVATILCLHLLSIAVGLGYNDLAWRDVALALATLSVAFHGPDSWSIDRKLGRR